MLSNPDYKSGSESVRKVGIHYIMSTFQDIVFNFLWRTPKYLALASAKMGEHSSNLGEGSSNLGEGSSNSGEGSSNLGEGSSKSGEGSPKAAKYKNFGRAMRCFFASYSDLVCSSPDRIIGVFNSFAYMFNFIMSVLYYSRVYLIMPSANVPYLLV